MRHDYIAFEFTFCRSIFLAALAEVDAELEDLVDAAIHARSVGTGMQQWKALFSPLYRYVINNVYYLPYILNECFCTYQIFNLY